VASRATGQAGLEPLTVREARRLALARAGLLRPERSGLPSRARGRGKRARAACHAVIGRFGYLQLDTVSVAGARSHSIVLLSRLEGLDGRLPEELLQPGEPLFEYWGHEASWLPLDLYPVFAFRRREFSAHPWWGDLVGQHPERSRELLRRIRHEGPLRSADFEGRGGAGWWNLKLAKKLASALWSSGELAIRERRNFQRVYDLAERVIPAEVRRREVPRPAALETLLLKALDGHGWGRTSTLTGTWRLRNRGKELAAALARLTEAGRIAPCDLVTAAGRRLGGWIRPEDREAAARLGAVRPRRDRGVLLSPFDPLLWDRDRVADLFGFEQVLEIFKPAGKRIYGYYCLPVLAGERLVARYDLKADRRRGRLHVLALHYEGDGAAGPAAADRQAAATALARYAEAIGLATEAG
jgi:uncharacterized protein